MNTSSVDGALFPLALYMLLHMKISEVKIHQMTYNLPVGGLLRTSCGMTQLVLP